MSGYRKDKGHGSLAQGPLRRLNGPFGWSATPSRTELPPGMARHAREIVGVCRCGSPGAVPALSGARVGRGRGQTHLASRHEQAPATSSLKPGRTNCGGARGGLGVLPCALAVIEMRQDTLDHRGIFARGNHLHLSTTGCAGLEVPLEHALQAVCPTHRRGAIDWGSSALAA